MVSKKIEFHEAASLELEAAFDCYLGRSKPTAVRFAEEIDEVLASIVQAPPTLASKQSIQIIAIAHGHRRPGYWKNRL